MQNQSALCLLLAALVVGAAASAPPCCSGHASAGCYDETIAACVCASKPSCCDSEWTSDCAEAVESLGCGDCSALPCCVPHGPGGCTARDTSACVCTLDESCCTDYWSTDCVQLAAEECNGCSLDLTGSTSCCAPHSTPGCSNNVTESCVCSLDIYCCQVMWDASCVAKAESRTCRPSWSSPTTLPAPLYGAGAATIGDTLYVIGGSSSQSNYSSASSFNVTSGEWTKLAQPTPRKFSCVVEAQGLVFFIGGYDLEHSRITDETSMYNPDSDSWTDGAPMPVALEEIGCTASDGVIYVVGGYDYSAEQTVYAYTISSDTWSELPELQMARGSAPAAYVINDLLYATGGNFQASMEVFDLVDKDGWKFGPSNNGSLGIYLTGYAQWDELFFMLGGTEDNYNASTLAQMYDSPLKYWSTHALPELPEGRVAMAAATCQGQLYAFGGSSQTSRYGYVPMDTVWALPIELFCGPVVN